MKSLWFQSTVSLDILLPGPCCKIPGWFSDRKSMQKNLLKQSLLFPRPGQFSQPLYVLLPSDNSSGWDAACSVFSFCHLCHAEKKKSNLFSVSSPHEQQRNTWKAKEHAVLPSCFWQCHGNQEIILTTWWYLPMLGFIRCALQLQKHYSKYKEH